MGSTTPIHLIRYPGGGDAASGLAAYYEAIALDVDTLLPIPSTSQPTDPGLGSIWYNETTGQTFIYDGSVFQAIGPLGELASVTGPGSQQDYTTAVNVLTLNVPVVAGRVYRVEGAVLGGLQITNTGVPTVGIFAASTLIGRSMSGQSYPASSTVSYCGYARARYAPSSTATVTFALQVQDSGSAGCAFRVSPNNLTLSVEDVGLA